MKLLKKKKLKLLKIKKKKNQDITMDLYIGENIFMDITHMEDFTHMEDSVMDYGDIECFY